MSAFRGSVVLPARHDWSASNPEIDIKIDEAVERYVNTASGFRPTVGIIVWSGNDLISGKGAVYKPSKTKGGYVREGTEVRNIQGNIIQVDHDG